MHIQKRIQQAKMGAEPETIVRIVIGTYDPSAAINELVAKGNGLVASSQVTEEERVDLLSMLASWETLSFSIRHEIVLILDALRRRPHVTHFSLDQAIAVAQQLKPKRTIFTHICHDLGHAQTNAELPASMELAYDGQRIELS